MSDNSLNDIKLKDEDSEKFETTNKSISEINELNFQKSDRDEETFYNGHYEQKFYDNIFVLGWTNINKEKDYKIRAKKIVEILCEKLKKEQIFIGGSLIIKILNYGQEFHKHLKKIINKTKIPTNYSILPAFYILVKSELSGSEIFDYNFFRYYICNRKAKFNKYLNLFKKYQNKGYQEKSIDNFKEKNQELVLYWLSRILSHYEKEAKKENIFDKAKVLFNKIFLFRNFDLIFSSSSIKYLSLCICSIIFQILVDNTISLQNYFELIKKTNFREGEENNNYRGDFNYSEKIKEKLIFRISYSTFQSMLLKIKNYFSSYLEDFVFSNSEFLNNIITKRSSLTNKLYFLKNNLSKFQIIWRKNICFIFKIIFLADKTLNKNISN